MTRVVSNAALDIDQLGDTTGGPQSVLEAQSLGSALQPALDSAQIRRTQARWTPDLLRFAKRTASTLFQLSCPATDRLPMDSDLSCDFGLAQAFAQQIDGLHPALLERIEISSYSGWVSHTREHIVTRAECHYVMQHSIGTDRCEEALDFYRNTLQTAPNDPEVLGGVVRAYYCLGMYEETYEAAVANQTGRGRPEAVAALEAGYADGGFTGAMSALAQWKEEQLGYCSDFNLAAAGKNGEALDCLELYFEEFEPSQPYIGVDPDLRSLRNEPRFQELLRRMDLPTSESPRGRE